MIPLRDNNPTRRFPVVCILLIIANILIFLADQATRVTIETVARSRYGVPVRVQEVVGGLSFRYALIPAYVTGATTGGMTPLVLRPAWLTIFTSMFLHGGWLHVGGNMLYLWIFGNNIEDVLGRGRFLLFYLACGVGAALLHIASGPGSPIPTVGASGAIAGLMGAYLLLYPHARILSLVPIFGIISTLIEVPALLVIGFWFLLQLISSQWLGGDMLTQQGGVAYLAHVGGFATGLLLIIALGGRRLLPATPNAPASGEEWER